VIRSIECPKTYLNGGGGRFRWTDVNDGERFCEIGIWTILVDSAV
jgi:hypothetical protein